MCVYKVVLVCVHFLLNLGDASVGKSAIAQVFHSDNSQFPKNYTMVYMTVQYSLMLDIVITLLYL